jgi:type I restriction enzyme, S subunit
MTAPIDIRSVDLAIVQDILRAVLPAPAKVYVFGSRALWTTKDGSDLDLAIDAGRTLTREESLDLADAFEESDLPYKVDVVDLHDVSESFKAIVDRDKVVLDTRVLKTIPLSETTKFIVDNRGKTAPTASSGIALIATNCISNGDLYPTYKNVRYVSSETLRDWFRANPEPGDIILTLKGSQNGAVCLVPEIVDFAIAQDMVALRANEKVIDPLFLFAALRSRPVQEQIRNLDVSGVIPHLKKGDFDKLRLPYPDRETQKFIGEVYFTLCNKIELNRAMNETLEAMARAIFKDWFVDFGPTRAKIAGQAPYLPPEIWSLFPDALDDEGKPEGWEFENVADQANWINGAAYKDMHFSSEPDALPVVKIAELKSGVTKTTRFTNTDLGERYKIRNGELLFSWSGNPDTSIDTFLWTGGTAWLNQHIFAVRSNGLRSQAFLYAMLKFLKSDFAEIARDKQTTGLGHVTKQDLIRMRIIVPSPQVETAFDETIGPIHALFAANLFESRSLAASRDFLLPKLMSGEVRVENSKTLQTAS